jgi:hypothetical protein
MRDTDRHTDDDVHTQRDELREEALEHRRDEERAHERQLAEATLAHDIGIREARERFGGLDLPAIIGGTLAALGSLLVLAIVGAALGIAGDNATTLATEDMTTAAVVAGIVILAVAAWAGGWVAGRLARYTGARNGALAGLTMVLFVLLAVGAGGSTVTDVEGLLGADILNRYGRSDIGIAAAVGILLIVLLSVGAGWVGGRLGERYHRWADATIAQPGFGPLSAPASGMGGIRGRGDLALETSRERERADGRL